MDKQAFFERVNQARREADALYGLGVINLISGDEIHLNTKLFVQVFETWTMLPWNNDGGKYPWDVRLVHNVDDRTFFTICTREEAYAAAQRITGENPNAEKSTEGNVKREDEVSFQPV